MANRVLRWFQRAGRRRAALALLWLAAMTTRPLAVTVLAQGPGNLLDETCVVSVLNRTVRVNADGTWLLPNIPAGFGPVRARATCERNGQTVAGESALFTIPPNGSVDVPPIVLGSTTPIPTSITVMANPNRITQRNGTAQLATTAFYGDGTSRNVTGSATGTVYNVSNANIASISPNGLVTGLSSGVAFIQAVNEGRAGFISVEVALAGDTDGDGIPDDIELQWGMNPNNPADAVLDPDSDGLNQRREYQAGTDPRNPDTDGDGLTDGEEVLKFGTNPLVRDTDGDGVPDGLEVQAGTSPTSAASVNFSAVLSAVTLTPATFSLTVNSANPIASIQLRLNGTFTGNFGTVDLTNNAGTNFSSNNLSVCNFGAVKGQVFAGNSGSCTITGSIGGRSATATGVVQGFTPTPLSYVSVPGFANNVDVAGNYAYVAAGAAGLVVVNVANKSAPAVVTTVDTPGNANDVVVAGNFAYVADGVTGLQIFNLSNPANPTPVSSFDTPGVAWSVKVRSGRAYIADGSNGLVIVNVSSPGSPALVGAVDTPGTAKGVDVDLARQLAVVADGNQGIAVINIANPATPVILAQYNATLGDARDVALSGNFAIVADYTKSMTSVNLANPNAPAAGASTPSSTGGLLNDVAVSNTFALGADVFFVNGVPLVDISNLPTLSPRQILNFSAAPVNGGDPDGQGIAVDGTYVYMTAVFSSAFVENGSTGNSRLFIGQYNQIEDRGGVAPTVSIVSPGNGAAFVAGETIPVSVQATDDVQVALVNLLVNNAPWGSDNSAPYEFMVPTGGTGPLQLRATANDLANNIGQSAVVNVSVIPDPLTTVRGRVVDGTGSPVGGAEVNCAGRTGSTGGDGRFTIASVPTVPPTLSCSATAIIGGQQRNGASAPVNAVRSGITEAGDITLGALRSRGRQFWILHHDIYLNGAQLMILSGQGGSYTISGAMSGAGNLTGGVPVTLGIPPSAEILTNQIVESKGILVETTVDASVFVHYTAGSSQDVYTAVPVPSLGNSYFALAYGDTLPARGFSGLASSDVAVVATQDGTSVTIDPTCASKSGNAAGSAVTVALNRGQTYQYQCQSPNSATIRDISGTLVSANKPVAVTASVGCADIPVSVGSCDVISEMMTPATGGLSGIQFYVPPLPTSGEDRIRILGTVNGTAVTVTSPGGSQNLTVDRGKFIEVTLAKPGGRVIAASSPVFVMQYLTGYSGLDPSSVSIVPPTLYGSEFRGVWPNSVTSFFAVIVSETASTAAVRVDGNPVANWTAFPGGAYSYAPVNVTAGQHVITGGRIAVYGVGGTGSGSYAFPLGF